MVESRKCLGPTHPAASTCRWITLAVTVAALLHCATLARSAPVPLDESLRTAKAGAVVKVGGGTFDGPFHVPPGVKLRGAGSEKTILRAPAETDAVVVLGDGASLEDLAVNGGQVGIVAKRAERIEIQRVKVSDSAKKGMEFVDSTVDVRNAVIEGGVKEGIEAGIMASGGVLRVEKSVINGWEDGLHFDTNRPTRLLLDRCVLNDNRDAVDLESTLALIRRCVFERCRDDAVDVDGESSCTVAACVIKDCQDDGIEIRLERRSHVLIADCAIDQSREDGIEVISTPQRGGTFANRVVIKDCTIARSKRYGIGLSDHKTEEANPEMAFPVTWSGVAFKASGRADVAPHKAAD